MAKTEERSLIISESFVRSPSALNRQGWWLGGSLTGTVSSNRVSEDFKGMFVWDGNSFVIYDEINKDI